MKAAASCVFALALLLPPPAAQARHIRAGMCNGGTVLLSIPADPKEDERRACCNKACHASTSKRKRAKPGQCCP